jgi:hypothetical protein
MKRGYHVVVGKSENDYIYSSRVKRAETDLYSFDDEWQSVGFFRTVGEAVEFETWLESFIMEPDE